MGGSECSGGRGAICLLPARQLGRQGERGGRGRILGGKCVRKVTVSAQSVNETMHLSRGAGDVRVCYLYLCSVRFVSGMLTLLSLYA